MNVIKIDKQAWRDGVDKLFSAYRVMAPFKQADGSHEFQMLEKGQTPNLECANTRRSPKSATFPQTELMMAYSTDENDPDCNLMKAILPDDSPLAVVGIRPCDARALTLVKMNFDTDDYQDPYWLKRYESAVFVGLACDEPQSTCFCTTAGGGPYNEDGLDVLLSDAGDAFLAKALTDKGKDFLAAGGWSDTTDDGGAFETGKAAAEKKIKSSVSTDQLAGKDTLDLHGASFWDEVGFACINCGTCTFVCPTCWCFDIQDETYGRQGVRMRNWDTCMSPLFTIHTTGHNPRGEKGQRVRQRFMHKLKYFLDKYEQGIMCTGCGRCVRQCPVNIDIRSVCEMMNNYVAEAQSA